MRSNVAMDEIPFAPLLSDTIPPVKPPSPALPVKRPQACRLIGWRHDGGLRDTRHETLEHAQAAATELHPVLYWKCAIMVGRDMVERRLIEATD